MSREILIQELEALHREVDRQGELLLEQLPELSCGRGCTDCCIADLTVFTVEAELIRIHHADLLTGGKPFGGGGCSLLSESGACRVYHQRPYVCRTQGLPLRWLEEVGGEMVEYRDICALNLPHLDPLGLPADHCWSIGPMEGRLRGLQERFGGESLERIPLGDLFTGGD